MSDRQPPLLLAPHAVEATGSRREGLYSLFRRTCERNQLTVNDVVYGLVLPLAGPSTTRLRKLIKPLHLMNSGTGLAKRFVTRMSEVSVVPNLMHATLHELDKLTGIAAVPVAPYRRWCPQCYQEDCEFAHGPYDRLLWSVANVEACPVHEVLLHYTCLACGANRMPVLVGSDLSGFCPHCCSFLGVTSDKLDGALDNHSSYILWVARSFADLLDTPLPVGYAVQEPFLRMIREISAFHFDGAYSHLAVAVCRNKSVVATWLAGRASPGWLAVCEISYVFHIPLRDLLSGESSAVPVSSLRPLPLDVRQRYGRQRKLPERRDSEAMRVFLSEVEDGRHPQLQTMSAIAQRLSIDSSDLRRRLPDDIRRLSAVLAERRVAARHRRETARTRDLDEAILQVGNDLAKDGGSLTRRNVELKLAKLGFLVRRPESKEVRRRVSLARNRALQQMSGTS